MLSYKLVVTLMELFRLELCLDWNFVWIGILFWIGIVLWITSLD